MANEKYVDGDFLSKLLSDSFEASVAHVESAVLENTKLFGGDDCEVRVIGTFSEHVIVANSDGEFFRARFAVDEGSVSLGDVERINVPVKEASELASTARSVAESVIDSMFSGDSDSATSGIRELYQLVSDGVRLSPESVVESLHLALDEEEWRDAIRENAKEVRRVAGASARVELPKSRFGSLSESGLEDDERVASVVESALRVVGTYLDSMSDRLELARTLDENSGFDSYDAAVDFMGFVSGLSESIEKVQGCVGDAIALLEPGTVSSLSEAHDVMADALPDLNLATSFAEGVALRFAPHAAQGA